MLDFLNNIGFYAMPLAGSVLLFFGLFQLVTDLRRVDEKKVIDRLTEGAKINKLPASIVRRRDGSQDKSLFSAALNKLSLVSWLQRALDQANMDWTASTFLLNVLSISLFGGIAMYISGMGIFAALGTAVAAFLLPLLVVTFKRKARLNRMLYQLPDVFDLMGQALRAGHSLANAIQLIGQQLPDPAGTEFSIVFHEQNLGIKIEEALKNMAKRLDLMDVRFFVTAVLINRSTGGDLAEVLDNIGAVIRERIKLFGQVKALTAEGRLSGYVLFALPFVVFAVEQVINPDYGRILIEEQIGRYCLIGALVAQLLGLAMIQKIVNIKV